MVQGPDEIAAGLEFDRELLHLQLGVAVRGLGAGGRALHGGAGPGHPNAVAGSARVVLRRATRLASSPTTIAIRGSSM